MLPQYASRLLIVGGVLALFALLVWAFRDLTTPIITDEIAYLTFAKQFAGENAGPFSGIGGYRFGQGLLLTPAFVIGQTIETTYRLAIVTSCLMTALVPLALLGIARELGIDRNWKTISAALLVAVMPAYLYQNALAWPETSFRLFFLVSIYLFARAWRTARTVEWLAAVLAVGWIYALHPRATGILVVFAFMLYIARSRKRITSAFLALMLLAALVGAAVLVSFVDAKMQALTFGGGRSDAQAAGQLLAGILSPGGLRRLLAVVMGQAWTQVATSFGLYLLGLVACWQMIRDKPNTAGTMIFAVLSCAAVFAASVMQMVQFSRVDHVIYGRYNDGVSTFFVWLGLCATISGASHRHARAGIGLAIIILALGTYLLTNGFDMSNAFRVNIPEISVLSGEVPLSQVLLVLSLIALAVCGMLYQTGPVVAVAMVVSASAVIGFAEKRDSWANHNARRAAIESSRGLFSNVSGDIYWDFAAATYADTLFDNFFLRDQVPPFVDLAQQDVNVGDAVIATRDATKLGYGCIGVLNGGARVLVRGSAAICNN